MKVRHGKIFKLIVVSLIVIIIFSTYIPISYSETKHVFTDNEIPGNLERTGYSVVNVFLNGDNENNQELATELYWLMTPENNDENYVGPVFETIAQFVVALGDAVMNVVQGWMLPTAPTAVAKRKRTTFLEDTLKKRDEKTDLNSYEFLIYKGETEFITTFNIRETEKDKNTANPVPFIYYSPQTIFSNIVPGLDVNFIDTKNQVRNPFFAEQESDGNWVYSDERMKKTQDLLVATELDEQGINFFGHSLLWIIGESNVEYSQREQAIRNEVAKEYHDERVASMALMDQDPSNDSNIAGTGNIAVTLQGTISQWYVAMRNIAVLGLLIVLIYIGIRIVISATADEKATYKQMLKNWFIGLVLVFVLHYIMYFLLNINIHVSRIFAGTAENINNAEGGDLIMNTIRSEIVHYNTLNDTVMMLGYAIMYLTLVWYTVMFTWRYIKRVLFMAFLTIIAPLVALTYPIDKMRDGQSQAFNMWFKEYLFNLLIQPIHLVLYTILITSAMELATTNIIYACVAIGFLTQAEKFIKSMFGLNAEGGLGAGAGSFAAGAAFSSLVSGLKGGASSVSGALGSGDDKGGGSGGDSDGSGKGGSPVKLKQEDFSSFANLGTSRTPSGQGLSIMRRTKENGEGRRTTIGDTLRNKSNSYASPIMRAKRGGFIDKDNKLNVNGKKINNIGLSGTGLDPNNKIDIGNPRNTMKLSTNGQPGRARRIWLGLGNVRKRYVNKNMAKSAAKLAAMGFGAGTLGLLGVSAGLASDDYDNVLKYGALGVGGGALVGKELFNQGEAITKGAINAGDTYLQGYHGEDYEEKVKIPRESRQWYNSAETRQSLIKEFGTNWQEAREMGLYLREKHKLTDQKDIEDAIKLTQKTPETFTLDNAAGTVKFCKDTDRTDFIDAKKRATKEKEALNLASGNQETADAIMASADLNMGIISEQEFNNRIKETKRTKITEEETTTTDTVDGKKDQTDLKGDESKT